MARGNFKRGSSTKHIRLDHWFCDCDAWSALKPPPRALYLELKRKFNGFNNGEIYLSHREAAAKLNVGRDTIGRYYQALIEHGFIEQTRGHCLGPSGIGQSASYSLTELPLDGKPATKEFISWKKENPRRKIQHSLAGENNNPCWKNQPLGDQRSKNTTALGENPNVVVSDNTAISTSSHIPTVESRENNSLKRATIWLANSRGLCGMANITTTRCLN